MKVKQVGSINGWVLAMLDDGDNIVLFEPMVYILDTGIYIAPFGQPPTLCPSNWVA